jgi:O-antigen ligase
MAGVRLEPNWPISIAVSVAAALVGLLAGVDPKLAIAAALGLVFTLVILSDLAAGLAVFTFLSLVAIVPLGAGPAVSFLKAVGLLLLLCWLATTIRSGGTAADFISSHQGLTYAIVLFLGWVALSQLWAHEPSASLLSLYRIALNAILFVIVYTAVKGRRELTNVMAAFVLGASVAALYGISHGSGESEADRLSGTLGNANELAAVLVVGAVFAAGILLVSRSRPGLRLIGAGGLGFCVFGVLLTLSRTGLVSLGVACVAAVLFSGRWRIRIMPLVVLVAVLAVGYFAVVASPDARDRVTNFGGGGTGRTDLWTVAWRMVEAEPVHGIGAGNFPTTAPEFLLRPGVLERSDLIVTEPKVAHNTYLEIFAELGLIGIALFAAILLVCLSCVWRAIRNFARRRERSMEILSRTLLVALIALLVADFFASEEFQKALWLLLALCPSVLAISRRDEDAACAE